MEHPVKVAFCPILFGATGGRFDEKGNPIFAEREKTLGISGLCDIAYDCGRCSYLHRWVESKVAEGFICTWECQACLKETKKVERELPGFYHSAMGAEDEDEPGLNGCTHCGHKTPLVQLVLRRTGVIAEPCGCEECIGY